jgi:hypothetical protein
MTEHKHPLPLRALENHIAVLAKTGAGKSYLAQGLAEGILSRKERLCIVDPTGRYWGLRSNAAGKRGGFPIVVFGGQHADVPLNAGHGATIAEIVGTTNTPCILDTRQLSVGERTRFFTAFAETLLRVNKGDLHLIIDEAHLFAPKGKVLSVQAGELVAATNNLVSLGRGVGLRIMFITQRPAKLHNDTLTQAETLIALRCIHPADRAAVTDWIKDCADPEQGREVISSLPTLPTGTGWIWAPGIGPRGMLKKVQFPTITTFDSGKPAASDGPAPTLATIDLPAIMSRLGKVADEAKANDPKVLRTRIAELEAKIAAAPAGSSVEQIQKWRADGFKIGWEAAKKEDAQHLESIGHNASHLAGVLRGSKVQDPIGEYLGPATDFGRPPLTAKPERRQSPEKSATQHQINKATSAETRVRAHSSTGALPKAERLILAALAQLGREARRNQVALMAGYRAEGGGFKNAISALRVAGLIEGSADALRITNAGLASLGPYEPLPPPGPDLIRHWISREGKAERAILAVMLTHAANGPMSRIAVADEAGYDANGGGFKNAVSRLRVLGIIEGSSELQFTKEAMQ